jgi:tRNA nucleotidyltransferase (CCA-adding enzyme)
MITLNQHFNKLLSTIEPNEERAKLAQDIPSKIRDYIKKHTEIITVEPQSRLAGSYARKTAICDIKDVDILIFLDSSYLKNKPEDVLTTLYNVLKDLP